MAKEIGISAHPFYEEGVRPELEKYRTLIHGDPKQANIFLRYGDDNANCGPEVGLIDFQWSGFGLAATDLAHHISAAVTPDCVSYDGSKEAELIDYYYSCLSNALVDSYTYLTLLLIVSFVPSNRLACASNHQGAQMHPFKSRHVGCQRPSKGDYDQRRLQGVLLREVYARPLYRVATRRPGRAP